jgi:hypothetical protein
MKWSYYIFAAIITIAFVLGATDVAITGREVSRILFKENPTPGEQQLVENFFTDLFTKTTSQEGAGTFEVGNLRAESGEFTITAPLSTAMLGKSAEGIATATVTEVTWDTVVFNHGGLINWKSGNPKRIYISGGNADRVLLLSLFFYWEADATGDRSLGYATYTSADVQIATYDLDLVKSPTGIGRQTISYPIVYDATASYLTIRAWQNSGSELDLDAELAITWLH